MNIQLEAETEEDFNPEYDRTIVFILECLRAAASVNPSVLMAFRGKLLAFTLICMSRYVKQLVPLNQVLLLKVKNLLTLDRASWG
jgi:hypothetical protein